MINGGSPVYRSLKEMIVNFSLKPGEQIVESRISEMLGVSKTPIREALLVLSKEGFVYRKSNFGSFVAKISIKDVSDIFELRNCLEVFVMRDIVKSINDEQVDLLNNYINLGEEAYFAKDMDKLAEYIDLFQDSLFACVYNKKIRQILDNLSDHLKRIRYITMRIQSLPERTHIEHRAIVSAIKKRDIEEVERLTREHIQEVCSSFFEEKAIKQFSVFLSESDI